jgi:hypothetical protein
MRCWTSVTMVAVTAATFLAAAEPPAAWTLTNDSLGKLPTGWTAAKTGQGEGSV